MKSINELSKLLGAENEQLLKEGILNILIERFRDDLEHLDEYLIDPTIIEDFVTEIVEECQQEVKEVVKKKLLNKAMEKLEKL